jgi:ribosomal protein S18 acetylase RimI-like enzyme
MTTRVFDVDETRDKAQLRSLLSQDPVSAAYLLGDLVEPFFSQCRWLVASYRGRIEGVVLLYTGLSVPALLSYGAPDAVEAVLERFTRELPDTCYAKLPLEHAGAVNAYYRTDHVERLWVMGLRASELIGPDRKLDATRLSKSSPLEPIESIYADYPGNYFEAGQLESGLYYGAYAAGRLVSIAGTHVLAPAEGIAVLGNVVTSAPARRSGYASACTARLIEGLAGMGCATVALQVAADNAAAITCYRNVGFRFRGIALQTRCERIAGAERPS